MGFLPSSKQAISDLKSAKKGDNHLGNRKLILDLVFLKSHSAKSAFLPINHTSKSYSLQTEDMLRPSIASGNQCQFSIDRSEFAITGQ